MEILKLSNSASNMATLLPTASPSSCLHPHLSDARMAIHGGRRRLRLVVFHGRRSVEGFQTHSDCRPACFNYFSCRQTCELQPPIASARLRLPFCCNFRKHV